MSAPAQAASAMAADDFRTVMAQVPAPVAIVTINPDGNPYGTTVSAFLSLSLDPPMVLISLSRHSGLLARITEGSALRLNVLGHQHAAIADRFARKDKNFTDLFADWETSPDEPPRLPDGLASVLLTVTEQISAGDHALVIATAASGQAGHGSPLVHWNRTYGTHRAC